MKSGKTTSLDIAFLAGVSQSTVSRALRDSPQVSKETRDRVQAIAREHGYKADINARNLRSQSAKTLALLFCEDPGTGSSLINPFFLSMLGSITKAAASRGYDLLVSFQQDSDDWNADFADTHKADGIIFLGYGDFTAYSEKITRLEQSGARFIVWGPVVKGQPGASIGCDNEASAYQAVVHLIDHGRMRIAFLGDISDDSPEFRARYAGYCRALRGAGFDVDPTLQRTALTTESIGFRSTEELLASHTEFDAIFAASDLIAIGAIKALKKYKLRVPEDIAVIGFDDIPIAEFCTPPLTTVHQDTILAGRMLVDNLIQLIDGEQIKGRKLPGAFVVRESCGCVQG